MRDDLLERFRRHDRRALAQLLSIVARGEADPGFLSALPTPLKPSRVIALTGGGGVGKSTLVGKLIERFRKAQQTVAVLACDPESPLSGGVLLGDRFRMSSSPTDKGVFIRSLAAVAGQGAIAAHLPAMIQLVESFGFDVILVETVGAGQGDTAVHALADGVVLLLQPETGDDLQWEKAGVMEVADVIVVHKADLPGAERAVGQVRSALDLAMPDREIALMAVSSRTEAGLDDLVEVLAKLPLRRGSAAPSQGDLVWQLQEIVRVRVNMLQKQADPAWVEIVGQWKAGKATEGTLADAFRLLGSTGKNEPA